MEELPGHPSNQMAPIGCFEASVSNYQSTLNNIPKSEDLATDFVDMIISKVIRDLIYSRNRLMTTTLEF
jgi:hypothetical protein